MEGAVEDKDSRWKVGGYRQDGGRLTAHQSVHSLGVGQSLQCSSWPGVKVIPGGGPEAAGAPPL